jgi:ATP-dependent RNA helicase DDX19/DBP5
MPMLSNYRSPHIFLTLSFGQINRTPKRKIRRSIDINNNNKTEQISLLNNHTHLRDISCSLTFEDEGINSQSSLHSIKTFEELKLATQLLKGIYDMGFRRPSCLQERALPQLLADPPRNMIGQSPSGTGKTVNKILNF